MEQHISCCLPRLSNYLDYRSDSHSFSMIDHYDHPLFRFRLDFVSVEFPCRGSVWAEPLETPAAFATACRRIFSGTLPQYSSSRGPVTSSIAIALDAADGGLPSPSRPPACPVRFCV